MSKYTLSQVRTVSLYMRTKGYDQVADMLREYAAHLAAQAEWPSEEDVRDCLDYIGLPKGLDGEYAPSTLARMRAALQSVRPPAVVVSDLVFQNLAQIAEGSMPKTAMQDLASEAYNTLRKAFRHAPTKD